MWNEAGQRLMEFCQENALVIANTLFQQYKRTLYTWTSPDGQHWPAAGSGALHTTVQNTSPFEGGQDYLHYPYHNLASGQTIGKGHNPAHQQKIGLKIY